MEKNHRANTRKHLLEYATALLAGLFCIVTMLLWLTRGKLQDQYDENAQLIDKMSVSQFEKAQVDELFFKAERQTKARRRAPQ